MLRALASVALLLPLGCADDPIEQPVPPEVARARACALGLTHDPPPDDGTGVRMYCSTPIFRVKDLRASLRHYEQRLGFSTAWVWGEPASFAAVRRGHVELFLCEDCQGQPGTWVSVFVDDVDQLHREYERQGATIVVPPTNYEWGMREMLVEDLDGHRLRMGQGID